MSFTDDIWKKAVLAVVGVAAVSGAVWSWNNLSWHFADVQDHHMVVENLRGAASKLGQIEAALLHQTGRVNLRDFGSHSEPEIHINRQGRGRQYVQHEAALVTELVSGSQVETEITVTGSFKAADEGLIGNINHPAAYALGLLPEMGEIRVQIRPAGDEH